MCAKIHHKPLAFVIALVAGVVSLCLLFLRTQLYAFYPSGGRESISIVPLDVFFVAASTLCLGLLSAMVMEARKAKRKSTLRQFTFSSPIGMLSLTPPDYTVEWANGTMAQLVDREPGELDGWELRDLFSTEDEYVQVLHLVSDSVTRGKTVRIDTRLARKDMVPVDVNLSGVLSDPGDSRSNVILTVSDISDRKRMEEGLRESEQHYRAAIESCNDGFAVLKNGRYLYVNQRWLEMFGYASADQIIGRRGHIVVHPKDRRTVSEYLRLLKSGNDVPCHCELAAVNRSGTTFYVEASIGGVNTAKRGTLFVFLRDVNTRKATEDVHRDNTVKLSDAMELARVVYWEADPLTSEYTFNDAFYSLLGTSAQKMGGYTMSSNEYLERFIHPDDVQNIRNHRAEAISLESQQMVHTEHRMVRCDGSIMHVASHARNVKDKDGRVIRICGVNQDVTERKHAEDALRESENKFRNLSEQSIVGIYLIQDSRFAYVNSRFARIHGYEPEEIIDRKSIRDLVFPEDLYKLDQTKDPGHEGFQFEFRIVTKTGEIKTIEIYGATTSFKGRPAVIGTLVDVTERKQTEESLRWKTAFLEAQVNSSLDGILVIDAVGNTILQNRRTIEMWKIPQNTLEQQDRRRQFKCLTGMAKQPKKLRDKMLHLHRNPDETGRYEIELKNGVVLDTYSCPVVGQHGEHYGRIWTFRDITELRHYWNMLENLSATDGLTELPNRRRFDEFLSREWRRGLRDQSLLSLILMDIDYFKEFNDHYGHLAGDDCLRQVASVLDEVVRRPGDLVARYGGEEFACVLPETDGRGAVLVAEKIQERMDLLKIPHGFSAASDHVTLSFGVATVIPKKGQNQSHLIDLADKLMYSAKQAGRHAIRDWRQPTKGRKVHAK
jgi:diguanylate cyclase (GGDEF)-like protein/PAS domain S-box-containing protein